MVGFFSLPWYNLWHQYTMNYLYLVIVVPMILFFWLLEITQPWSFYGYIHFLWLAHGMQMLGHRQSIIESRCCWETTWQSTFKSALDVWVHANLPKFFFYQTLMLSALHCDIVYLKTIYVEYDCIGHLPMLFFILPSSLSLGNFWKLCIFLHGMHVLQVFFIHVTLPFNFPFY